MSDLPAGTVTFLFTDIEGSTTLLQRLRDRYETVLGRHRDVLRAAFATWHGREVGTEGDSFFVAFARASDAVAAAVDAQRGLAACDWPPDAPVRVRMGLHTGEAKATGDGYVGIDVHRAARISAAGHGGQVLLSQSTRALVERELPDGVTLHDLGEHRLKDLRYPEHIFQLVIAGLNGEYPPLRSLNAHANNLPAQPTSFVGRERELQHVRALVNEKRLVTLTGPGGAGKTRLSLQVAADMVEAFPHGVWYVGLAPVASTEHLIPAVAGALRFPIDTHSSDLDPKSQLLDYLERRSVLLVLDNFEHLVDGAGVLADILARAAESKLLVTSRERLNLRDEWTFDVTGLSYPTNGGGEEYSALALFVERARQADPGFILSAEARRYAVRICQIVEGMPLGIELAAAWASALSCREIAEEVERNLDFLSTTMRDVADQHRSLRAVFDHSWRMLTEEQKTGFRRLSVFRGSFSRDAAQKVGGVDLRRLSDLVGKSLLRRTTEGRYELHQLLRQYAEDALSEVPAEQDAASERHSRYFGQFLIERKQRLEGREVTAAGDEIRADLGNVTAAARWVAVHGPEDDARRVLDAMTSFYWTQGWHEAVIAFKGIADALREEGAGLEPGRPRRAVLVSALGHQAHFGANLGGAGSEAISRVCVPVARDLGLELELAMHLYSLGICLTVRDEYASARAHFEEAIPLFRTSGEVSLITAGLLWLGWVDHEEGNYDAAGERFQEAYRLCRQQGNRSTLPYALSKLGTWADATGDFALAMKYHQEAHEIFAERGDTAGEGYTLSRMSLSTWGMGDYAEASRLAQAGYERFLSIGHRWGTAVSLCRLGFAELGLGQRDEARRHFKEGLEHAARDHYRAQAIYALIGLGSLAAREGDRERAVELLSLALAHQLTPARYKDIARPELAVLETSLPAEVFTAARARGQASDLDAVIEALAPGRHLAR